MNTLPGMCKAINLFRDCKMNEMELNVQIKGNKYMGSDLISQYCELHEHDSHCYGRNE